MNASFARQEQPIDEGCDCYTCRTFSRAYLRHLIVAGESVAGTLLSIHNLRALIRLVGTIREAIESGTFHEQLPALLTRWSDNARRRPGRGSEHTE